MPVELPLPMAADGSYSADGARLAYVPLDRAFSMWKRYRGGETSPIWIATLADSSVEKIPRDNSNDFNPMWVGEKVYFLSDRNGPVSLFAYDTREKTVSEIIHNEGLDFKSASVGPGAIVYEQFGTIHLYDLKSGKSTPVSITVTGDLPEVRPHFVKAASKIHSADLSPTGTRAVFEARGEILTVPAEKGDIRNLTETPGVNERSPAWAPDGKYIAYFSDESGEYALHVRSQSGTGETRKIGLGTPGSFFYSPTWSPDSKKIAYTDKRLNLWYVDLQDGKPVHVFKDTFTGPQQLFKAAWSPDGKWLAYTKQGRSHMRSVYVYSLDTGQSQAVTDGMSDAQSPVFDRGGKYLYLLSSTDAGVVMDSAMTSYDKAVTSSVYLVVLRKDLPSPLAPESDEEKEVAAEVEKSDSVKPPPKPAVVTIDFEKINQRILALPLPPKNYQVLEPGKEGVLFAVEGGIVNSPTAPPLMTAYRFDLKTRKSDNLISGISYFRVSANGEKMLYRIGAQPGNALAVSGTPTAPVQWIIAGIPATVTPATPASPSPTAPRPNTQVLKLDEMEVRVDPRVEWRQMYHEAFRLERDFFYDPGFHGLNLAAAEKKYEPYLDRLGARTDLNYLFEESLGGLTVGHLRVNGGDFPNVAKVTVGLLGADYKIENGRYRFARVFDGENRYFFPQAGKQGAVVDERFNGGGTMTDYILTYLQRKLLNYRTTRDGEDTTWPVSLIQGPKALIINEYAGSGGDAMPFHFREVQLGPLVGKRTWGGLVGFFGPQEDLMDGGIVSTPSRGFWTPKGEWEIENHGVAPDVEVELDPKAVREGHDPQLEKTVALLLADLEQHPIPKHKKPPYPNYSNGAGVSSR